MTTTNKNDIRISNLKSMVHLSDVEPEIKELILKDQPELKDDSLIDFAKVMEYRLAHIKDQIKSDNDEMATINKM